MNAWVKNTLRQAQGHLLPFQTTLSQRHPAHPFPRATWFSTMAPLQIQFVPLKGWSLLECLRIGHWPGQRCRSLQKAWGPRGDKREIMKVFLHSLYSLIEYFKCHLSVSTNEIIYIYIELEIIRALSFYPVHLLYLHISLGLFVSIFPF